MKLLILSCVVWRPYLAANNEGKCKAEGYKQNKDIQYERYIFRYSVYHIWKHLREHSVIFCRVQLFFTQHVYWRKVWILTAAQSRSVLLKQLQYLRTRFKMADLIRLFKSIWHLWASGDVDSASWSHFIVCYYIYMLESPARTLQLCSAGLRSFTRAGEEVMTGLFQVWMNCSFNSYMHLRVH